MTKANIQQYIMSKFKHFSWSYMHTSDMCILGFSLALSVAHVLIRLIIYKGAAWCNWCDDWLQAGNYKV
jgi:hypothetical protein